MVRERASPIIVICCTGLMAEFVLPWAVIWLSGTFFFDIRGWSLWLLFDGPPGAQPCGRTDPSGPADTAKAATSCMGPRTARAIARL
jgi:hypothetical protein